MGIFSSDEKGNDCSWELDMIRDLKDEALNLRKIIVALVNHREGEVYLSPDDIIGAAKLPMLDMTQEKGLFEGITLITALGKRKKDEYYKNK